MKGKIIFSVILSAILLTACNSGGTDVTDSPADNAPAESTETTAETEIVPETTTTAAASETAEETATTAAETIPSKIENFGGDVELDFQTVDIGGILPDDDNYIRLFILSDTAALGTSGGEGDILFFDLNEPKLKGKVSSPEGWKFNWYYDLIEGSGDILCTAGLYRYNDEGQTNYAALVVRRDFSAEVVEDGYEKALAMPAGSHNISVLYDIIDADSGAVLVEGVEDNSPSGFGNMSVWYDYKFAIDGDRFVYRACGIERMPSFGYYDFTNGAAVDFPESRNFMPIGYHDGKIYAEETEWDGMCQGKLCTFDVETLKSEVFIPQNENSENSAIMFTEYTMSPDGSFIIANDFDGSGMNILRIISPDSGETLVRCELNFGGSYGSDFTFIDDGRFAAFGDYTGEIVIFDVKMQY